LSPGGNKPRKAGFVYSFTGGQNAGQGEAPAEGEKKKKGPPFFPRGSRGRQEREKGKEGDDLIPLSGEERVPARLAKLSLWNCPTVMNEKREKKKERGRSAQQKRKNRPFFFCKNKRGPLGGGVALLRETVLFGTRRTEGHDGKKGRGEEGGETVTVFAGIIRKKANCELYRKKKKGRNWLGGTRGPFASREDGVSCLKKRTSLPAGGRRKEKTKKEGKGIRGGRGKKKSDCNN